MEFKRAAILLVLSVVVFLLILCVSVPAAQAVKAGPDEMITMAFVAELSEPFGTEIEFKDGIGVWVR